MASREFLLEVSKNTRFQKGNKMQERKRGMKYNVRKSINAFLKDIPNGQKPWERIYQMGNADPESVSMEIQFQANKTLGQWGLDDDKDPAIQITAETLSVENIDNAILEKLGLAKDEQGDLENHEQVDS